MLLGILEARLKGADTSSRGSEAQAVPSPCEHTTAWFLPGWVTLTAEEDLLLYYKMCLKLISLIFLFLRSKH